MRADALHALYSSVRRTGYTTAIAKAAKSCDGVVLCRNAAQAAGVVADHGVRVATLFDVEQLRGQARPIFPDNAVMAEVFGELARLEARCQRDAQALFELSQDRVALKSELFFHEAALEAMAILRQEAELRGAFYCLAMVGLAVALGTLADRVSYTVGTLEIYLPGRLVERSQLRDALEACGMPAPI